MVVVESDGMVNKNEKVKLHLAEMPDDDEKLVANTVALAEQLLSRKLTTDEIRKIRKEITG